jgi:hypothetical protein
MIQALGLQHNVPAGIEGPEETAQKRNLFWTIYMTEKMLSLRLGRSSTFRDQDITLTRPGMERSNGSFLAELAPGWINIASIQGRIYDDIYSPGALMQPLHIRTSRARALAAELKTAMQHAQDIHVSLSRPVPTIMKFFPHDHSSKQDRMLTGHRTIMRQAKGKCWDWSTTI